MGRLAQTLGGEVIHRCAAHSVEFDNRTLRPSMQDVKALENAVKALPPQDLAEFRRWFAEFDLAVWYEKIEVDLSSSKLDALLSEAEEDYNSGEPKSL